MKKDFRPYAIAIVLFLVVVMMESCASRCKQQRRYWNTHRVVQVPNDTLPNYFYHNNQIVMVYKNS
jgi:hypothetical protein